MTDEQKKTWTFNPAKYEGHTPGPWRVVEDTGYLAEWDECGVVETDDQHIAFTFSHDVPDARLIADAPKLLDEVKRLRSLLSNLHSDFSDHPLNSVKDAAAYLKTEGGEA